MKSPTFSVRLCPACGSGERLTLCELKPEQFCSTNWTYSNNYKELLNILDDMVFPIDRCIACGFVYARLLPATEFLSCVYDKVISRKGCLVGSENHLSYARRMRYIAVLLEMVSQKSALKALDFGCGLGISLKLLSAAGIEAIGFDPSNVRTTYAENAGYIMVTDETYLKRYAPYDIIICDNVLEHVPEPSQTVASLASLCYDRSLLYISVPNYEEKYILKQLSSLEQGLPLDMTLNPWEHLNYFDTKSLDCLMENSGFTRIPAAVLPGPLDIGLRPETGRAARLKNSLASLGRLIRYVVTGEGSVSVCNAFYRFSVRQA